MSVESAMLFCNDSDYIYIGNIDFYIYKLAHVFFKCLVRLLLLKLEYLHSSHCYIIRCDPYVRVFLGYITT